MNNLDTVKQMYEAYGRGDIPAILDKLDENVEWDTETSTPGGVPWLEPRRGKASIPGFFESLAPLEFTRFEPHTFFESGEKVFVLIAIEANNEDKHYAIPNEGHLWQFNASGKVVKLDHVTDTALHWRMANGR